MKRNIYIILGIIFILLIGIVMVYQHIQHKASDLSAEVQELNIETEDLSQDIDNLEGIADDSGLNSLDNDLSDIVDESSGELELEENLGNIGNELEEDLKSISEDLVNLDFEDDIDFDSALSGI